MTREEFFARPNFYYYLGGQPVPNEWIAQAWEEIPEFRDNITYGITREACKVGGLDGCKSELEFLDSILPLHRMVEIYDCARPIFRTPMFEAHSGVFGFEPQPRGTGANTWANSCAGVGKPNCLSTRACSAVSRVAWTTRPRRVARSINP